MMPNQPRKKKPNRGDDTDHKETRATGPTGPNPAVCFVYLLTAREGRQCYVGATVDVDRRLRQHNSEIKGGAKRTTQLSGHGEVWRRVCYVAGFPCWQAALQFEWRWKRVAHQCRGRQLPSLDRHLTALHRLLCMPRATTAAIPFAEWPVPPSIRWDIDATQTWFRAHLPLPLAVNVTHLQHNPIAVDDDNAAAAEEEEEATEEDVEEAEELEEAAAETV